MSTRRVAGWIGALVLAGAVTITQLRSEAEEPAKTNIASVAWFSGKG